MGWGEWCVPTMTESQQFEAEKYRRIMHNMASQDPTSLAAIAADLARQNIMLQSIVAKATRHILALEVERELSPTRSWRQLVGQIASRLPWIKSAA